ncbi:ABC transporter substrate-binding protein [Chloroflexota bacterium]
MAISFKIGITVLAILLLASMFLTSCGDDDATQEDKETPIETIQQTEEPAEDVVITIGNLTDLTGPAAATGQTITMALEDVIGYYNEQNLIPGVELDLVTYDGQLDPSKDIPGYEWLLERGADVIFTIQPATPITLKPRVDSDQVILFAASGDLEFISPPGYVFVVATSVPQYEAYTLLNWIAANDWDYAANGPARIGGAGWDWGYSNGVFAAMEEYSNAHPDQFDWAGAHLTPLGTFIWGPEVDALKDCDYVFVPESMTTFVREFRSAGYEARFLGSDVQASVTGLVDDANLWDEIDGMLFVRGTRWWNEEGELLDLAKQLLYDNHPGEADSIIHSGNTYLAANNVNVMLDLIAQTVESVGPGNFDSQALYDVAQSYSMTVEGIEGFFSFSETKRLSANYYAIYEARSTERDIFRADPEWVPISTGP